MPGKGSAGWNTEPSSRNRDVSIRDESVLKARCITLPEQKVGGEEGIRTPGSLPASTVFKTAALNHSAPSPRRWRSVTSGRLNAELEAVDRTVRL